jgi:Helix-turn-helix domain/DnaJ domain
MIKKIEALDFYEVLEVSSVATTREIHQAYERLRKIYDPNSIALYSLFTPEETTAMQTRIEEAYRTLVYEDKRRQYDAALRDNGERPVPEASSSTQPPASQPVRPPASPPADNVPLSGPAEGPQRVPDPAPALPSPAVGKPVPEFIGEFTGPAIKALREQSGRELRTIADLTKVSIRYLEFVELENFRKLPARTYIRGFLMLYAKALGCDAERLASDYLKRYDAAMKPAKTK